MDTAANERICYVTRTRSAVDEARHFAEREVAHCDADCRRAVSMVVSEFAENVVKYSARDDPACAGTIAIECAGAVVRIRARNAVASPEEARRVQELVT